jgi:hypothetical protein
MMAVFAVSNSVRAEERAKFIESGTVVSVPNTCNSVVFAQVPRHPDFFLGRAAGEHAGTCTEVLGKEESGIALFKMDWARSTMNFKKLVLGPATKIVEAQVYHSSEPSVVEFNGELWVAFECATGYTSTCVGPFNFDKGIIDPDRTTVPVAGRDFDQNSRFGSSAAVPNMFVFHDRLYVYWSAIKATKADRVWHSIAVRGAELEQEPVRQRRIWVKGWPGRPVASTDPAHTVEVLAPDPTDPSANQSVDVKGVYADGTHIYLFTSIGGKGPGEKEACLNPGGATYGCWRIQIFRSVVPLGKLVFNPHPLVSPRLPLNAAAYQRPFIAPDGSLRLIGEFFPPGRGMASSDYVLHLERPTLINYRLPLPEFEFR